MPLNNVLVVDDETKMQRILEIMLQGMGIGVLKADNGQAALEIIESDSVDLVVTDIRMPVMDGMTLVRELHKRPNSPPVIMITAHGSVDSAVEAMRLGAVDYIIRPFEVDRVELAVRRVLTVSQVQRENRFLRNEVYQGWGQFIGSCPAMREMYELISQVSPSDVPVLIQGETGTGKELVARAIHHASGRTGPFVPINCAGIPETLLESELFGHVLGAFTGATTKRVGKCEVSDGGTLFLDEITEMPTELQTRLLRVLQEHCIERLGSNHQIDLDLRIIAATNRDPVAAIASHKLREDLYYRINGFPIVVPPLRERDSDIRVLAQYFLERHAKQIGRPIPQLNDQTLRILSAHHWSGNVRELENLMGRVVLLASTADAESVLTRELGLKLPSSKAGGCKKSDDRDIRLQPRMDALERGLIRTALDRSRGNKAKTARLLEVSERTLWYKVKKYDLK